MEVHMEKHKCPSCGHHMAPKNHGQRVGSVVGGFLGVLARYGAIISAPAAAITALLAGAITGQKIGEIVDDHVIRSFRCPKCGNEISL
jgi:predicted RNA-binding Zn-ribbon protein involved in translation (DUF1610 family)